MSPGTSKSHAVLSRFRQGLVKDHSNNNYLGVIDEKDSRIFGKKLINDLGVILKELEPFKKEVKGIVVESMTTGIGWWTD